MDSGVYRYVNRVKAVTQPGPTERTGNQSEGKVKEILLEVIPSNPACLHFMCPLSSSVQQLHKLAS